MYSATFLIAVHPSSVTSSISHRSTVTPTWREVRTRASRRPSSSSVNRPQATTYGSDSGLSILSMTAMTGNPGIWKPAAQSDRLGSHTAEGPPQNPYRMGASSRLAVRRGPFAGAGEEGPVPKVQFRVHDETVAIAHGIAATPIAVVRMDELRVSTG